MHIVDFNQISDLTSQARLAEVLHINRVTLKRAENGGNCPPSV